MSKNTSGITAINIEAFLSATNPHIMDGILVEHLPRYLSSNSGKMDLLIPRVIPRGKRGFAIQYDMKSFGINSRFGDRLTLFGHLLGPDEEYPEYASSETKAVRLDNPRMVIPLFPYDPELANLADLFSDDYTIPGIVTTLGFPKAVKIRLLAYRLGRRCTISYELGGGDQPKIRVIAKVVNRAARSQLWQNLPDLERHGFSRDSEDKLTVPHLIGVDDQHNAYFMEFADGISLHDLIGRQEFVEGCRAAGRILKKLHASQMNVNRSYTYGDEIGSLEQKFGVAGELFPQWQAGFSNAIAILGRHSDCLKDAPSILIHRDFYDKQVLYAITRVTLLDCDGVAMGDPALDYGNFMAHVTLRTRQTPEHTAIFRAAAESFADSYGSGDSNFAERTRWWKASALTRLASLYSLRPKWRHLAPVLLEDAANTLSDGI